MEPKSYERETSALITPYRIRLHLRNISQAYMRVEAEKWQKPSVDGWGRRLNNYPTNFSQSSLFHLCMLLFRFSLSSIVCILQSGEKETNKKLHKKYHSMKTNSLLRTAAAESYIFLFYCINLQDFLIKSEDGVSLFTLSFLFRLLILFLTKPFFTSRRFY